MGRLSRGARILFRPVEQLRDGILESLVASTQDLAPTLIDCFRMLREKRSLLLEIQAPTASSLRWRS
jgi:hypothetical protein